MGESIAEGTLSKWLKRVGDPVKRDEAIFEISTDKVDAEIPSAVAGVLAEILVEEGQTVAVQTVVARIETEKGATIESPAVAPAPVAAEERVGAASSAERGAPPKAQAATSAPATPHPFPAADIAASGVNGFESRLRTKSSPLVRKIAAEHGIELARIRAPVSRGASRRRTSSPTWRRARRQHRVARCTRQSALKSMAPCPKPGPATASNRCRRFVR